MRSYNVDDPVFVKNAQSSESVDQPQRESTDMEHQAFLENPPAPQDILSSSTSNNHQPIASPSTVAEKPAPQQSLRESKRRKRPPAWTEDYVLHKRRRDIGIPSEAKQNQN